MQQPVTAQFTEGGVEVTLAVSASIVTAALRPTRSGFHVYSIGLPPGGIDGLGVPTRLDVRAGLTAAGETVADHEAHMLALPALKVRLPVYPDGPVTLSLPVRHIGRTGEIVISYGACSASICLAPVIDRVTTVALD